MSEGEAVRVHPHQSTLPILIRRAHAVLHAHMFQKSLERSQASERWLCPKKFFRWAYAPQLEGAGVFESLEFCHTLMPAVGHVAWLSVRARSEDGALVGQAAGHA